MPGQYQFRPEDNWNCFYLPAPAKAGYLTLSPLPREPSMKIFLATVSNSDQNLGTTLKPVGDNRKRLCFESKVNVVRDLQNRSNQVRHVRHVFQFIDGDHDDGDDDKLCAAAAH